MPKRWWTMVGWRHNTNQPLIFIYMYEIPPQNKSIIYHIYVSFNNQPVKSSGEKKHQHTSAEYQYVPMPKRWWTMVGWRHNNNQPMFHMYAISPPNKSIIYHIYVSVTNQPVRTERRNARITSINQKYHRLEPSDEVMSSSEDTSTSGSNLYCIMRKINR